MLSDTTSGSAASDTMETGAALATPAPLRKSAMETVDSPEPSEPSGPDRRDSGPTVEYGTPLHNFLEDMEEGSSDKAQDEELAQILGRLNEKELNQPDEDGMTPLHIAARRGLLKATKNLLDKGVGNSIKHKDHMERQPLHCACISGQKEIVNLLLASGADLEAKQGDGRTPLGEACYWENLDVMNELLSRGAKVDVVDEDNQSLLNLAVGDRNIDIVKRLLKEEHLDLNNRDNYNGWTALHRAAYWGEEEIVDMLLEKGASTSIQDNDGWTPLYTAACGIEGTAMEKFLFTAQGERTSPKELEIADEKGYTPLLAAIERRRVDTVRVLIKAGANCNAEDKQGVRALHHATTEGDESIVSLLLKSGADCNAQDREARRALHYASNEGYNSIVLLLIQGGADCNAADKKGRRALHDASTQGHDDIVTTLLKKGAMVNPRDKDRKTPLQLAFDADQSDNWDERDEIMRCFLKANDSNTTELGIDGVKDDVLVWAAKSSNRHDIATLLMKKSPEVAEPSNSDDWSAIHWACYRILPQILWLLLANSPETNDSKKMVKSALELIKTLRPGHKSKENKRQRAPMDQGEGDIPLESKMTAGSRDSKGAEGYNTLADILQDPPFAQYTDSEQIQIREPSEAEFEVMGKFDAAVTQIFREKGKSIVIQAEHGIMNVNREQDAGKSDVDISTKGNHQKATEINANSDFWAASATYMPYLRFSSQCNGKAGIPTCVEYKDNEQECRRLSEAHPDSVVHTSPTLDEWYYGFATGDDFSEDRNYRNENQVATRELVGDVSKLTHWPLLRVNQLWIWTFGNKWIITAAPDPKDSRSPTLLDGVLEHLNKLGRAGESSSQPGSTFDMRQLLVDYCIESYERKPVEDEFVHFEHPEDIQRASIRQLFSNSIKKLVGGHLSCGKPLVSEDTGKPGSTIVKHLLNAIFGGVEIRKAIKQAEKLSCDVKDIRDELNILKSVATYQKDIQDKLSSAVNKGVRSNLTAKYVEGDINGMDKVAERIQSAVDTTLALQQGQETVRQGRTLMVFTVVTIIFVKE
ncbi:unnamed protein product [Clonostachys rosea]|uniref:Uncharacterized protein n=1 Tax=Bionectria ochroleuca TaxID=29856 RepID=A0ABY6UCL2_BIOOC|nr:unnamed protein product [Clonostachys rosea]